MSSRLPPLPGVFQRVAALNELTAQSGKGIMIEESLIPFNRSAVALTDLLGLDPLQLANEGAAVVIVSERDAGRALEMARNHPLGRKASIIGRVTAGHPRQVILKTRLGTEIIVQMRSGESLPRIC